MSEEADVHRRVQQMDLVAIPEGLFHDTTKIEELFAILIWIISHMLMGVYKIHVPD